MFGGVDILMAYKANMGKGKIISVLILCGILILFTGCLKEDKEDNGLDDFCKEYISEYSIIQENDDGTFVVSVMAPDMASIMENMSENSQEKDIDVDDLEDMIKDYPNYKEYVFVVNELTNSEIQDKFSDEIAKDLVISAIKNIEYNETWSAEE